jgi:two-component system CheB/CheR fusion protein
MAQGENCSWTDEDAFAFAELMLRYTQQHGLVFYDTKLRIRGWNHGAAFITGWTDQEVMGQSFGMTFVPEDREGKLHEHEAAVARQMGSAENERWHLRKDGSRFWSSGVSVPLKSAGGEITGFVKIFRDATHLRARMKYLENELQESNARHQQRDTFVGTIAHEMRNPLGPLHMALELMKRVPDEANRYGEMLRVMDRQLGFLRRLVEDLVDVTRVHAGKLSIAYAVVELQSLLNEAMESCRAAAEGKGIAMHAVLPEVPIHVEVDPQRLQQVVVNLLNNAIKFTAPGGGSWVTATADQTHVMLYVKDNGRGIAAELLPKIFDVFTQAQGSGSERGAGLGIGLTVVKEIVSLHQGSVEVRSEGPGKGSEFIVRIPLRQPHGSEPEPLPIPPGGAGAPRG